MGMGKKSVQYGQYRSRIYMGMWSLHKLSSELGIGVSDQPSPTQAYLPSFSSDYLRNEDIAYPVSQPVRKMSL